MYVCLLDMAITNTISDLPQPNYRVQPLPSALKEFPDRVSQTLIGKTLLITGGTGFLGKVLLEKILRKCPGVGKIYLLSRPKRGKEPKQRIEELFASPVSKKLS